MAVRSRVKLLSGARYLTASRHGALSAYSTSFVQESKTSKQSLDDESGSVASSRSNHPPKEPPDSDSHFDSSAAKIFSHQPVIVPRRPVVRPPPTLTLPPSVSSPAIRSAIIKRGKQDVGKERDTNGEGEPGDDLWSVYQGSLNERDAEPSIDDLMALRPLPSTISAALDGVLGAGRTLLPEKHQLRLDIEYLGAQEAPVGGGPKAKKKVVAGSGKAKKLEYSSLYEATERSISQKFTVAQLRHFEEELNPGRRYRSKGGSKQKIIHRIMHEQFRMMHPISVQNQVAELTSKVEERKSIYIFHSVSPSELFILLGRDGENLLNVSKQLLLNVSVDREHPAQSGQPWTSNGTQTAPTRFALRASGTKASHQKLKKYLEELRKSVITRKVVLPTGPPLLQSRLQRISRTADAFCENLTQSLEDSKDDGLPQALVLITARDARNAYTAERLVQRAALEDAHRSHITLLSQVRLSSSDSSKPEYALYPFDTQNFRLQRCRDAKPERDVDEDEAIILGERPHLSKGEDEGQKVTSLLAIEDNLGDGDATTISLAGEAVDLRRLLFDTSSSSQGPLRKVVATFGHVVFRSPNPSSLLPPLGPTSSGPALQWTREQESNSRSFAPGVVPLLVRLKPSSPRLAHQLQYHQVEGDGVVDVSVELPSMDNINPEPVSVAEAAAPGRDAIDHLELTEKHGESDSGRALASSIQAEAAHQSASEPTEETEPALPASVADPDPLPFEISIGTEEVAEIMMPDSTLDMTLRVSNTSPLESAHIPEVLRNYLDDLSKFFTTDADMFQPDPPQMFHLGGRQFILVKNTSGESSVAPILFNAPGSSVTTETTLDLEDNAQSTFTQVSYDGVHGTQGWEAFLRLCQTLAAKPYGQEIYQAKPSAP
ncbi:hypothetical protein RhiLY_11310 [Ceratobasidium sp. AG-Ba]|nr:hypothetical protein RhiLY_11310 [Ceratobasidium sp. AG-Ba]